MVECSDTSRENLITSDKEGVMDRRTIARRLQSVYGKGMVNTTQVAKFMGVSRETAAKLLDGIDFIHAGKGNAKAYLVDDVAEMIMRNRG